MATFTSNIPMVINNSTIMKDVSTQNIDISQNLFVSGSSTFIQGVDLCGQVTIDNNLDVYGSVFIKNNLDVSGNFVIGGSLDISYVVFKNVGISGDVVIDGTLDISDVTIKGNLNVQNSTYTYDKTTINSIDLDICDNIIKINVKENQDLPSGIMIQDICTNVFFGYSGRKETQEHSDKFIITKTNYDETLSDTPITYDKSVDVFINGSLDVSGTIRQDGFRNIPIGGIIMWSSSSVPSGWALCDGTNGTPNLKGKFVIGMDEFNTIGNSGGSLNISSDNLPTHSHSGTTINKSHSHTINSNNTGGHFHNYSTQLDFGLENDVIVRLVSGSTHFFGSQNYTTNTEPNHSHTYETDTNDSHSHTFTTDTCGNSSPYYPPYYVLTYIMRIS